jgi:hypothetical protein
MQAKVITKVLTDWMHAHFISHIMKDMAALRKKATEKSHG